MQVGLGPHGRNWARRVIPDLKQVDLVAYVDSSPNALDVLREEAKVPAERCFESLKEAIAETRPDAMLVTTALAGHVPVVHAALEAGPQLPVEKAFGPKLGAAPAARG